MLLALLAGGLLSADGHDANLKVEVSITNLTRGQILSPVFVARHDQSAASIYALGEPASDALAKMAEDADSSGLKTMFKGSDTMMMMGDESMMMMEDGSMMMGDESMMMMEGEASTEDGAMMMNFGEGPVLPGHTVTASFDIDDGDTMMSFVSMMVSTNDAFIGGNSIDLSKSRTLYLTAYDSGSEANSESCDYIPGPPCGNHVEDEASAEGYVHVHAGIHGGEGSGLDPAMHDWRNPVARLTIKTWQLSR